MSTSTIVSQRPSFKTATPQFSVRDVVATAEYYRSTLGFEIRGFFGDPPVFATVGRDGVEIFFSQLPPGDVTPRVRAPVAYDAYLHVTDVDALAAELQGNGALIREGPVIRSYQMRELVVGDLNGLVLAFGESTADRPSSATPAETRGFVAGSIRLAGAIDLPGSVDDVFELFSPLGEKMWVPGWNPELLHPSGVTWEEGLIFRTRDETGEAIWIVMHLDRGAHEVQYHRVEPGRYVARITVRCAAVAGEVTRASIVYEFVGLSESGNAEIAGMTEEAYSEKMARWTRWIGEHLSRRR